MSYHIHKTTLKRRKSYIKSLEWISNKRETINPKNKDNKCFQYPITVALNHKNNENHPKRILNINPFIDQYSWKGIDFPAGIKNWKKSERNNKKLLLMSYLYHTIKKQQISNTNQNVTVKWENQVIFLIITNSEKWHYIALKGVRTDDGFNRPIRSLSRLFRGITSNNHGDFYCLGCLHSFRTDNALKKHERLCDNNDYCHVEMPTEDNNKLKYNHGEKSLKAPFAIYADLECL